MNLRLLLSYNYCFRPPGTGKTFIGVKIMQLLLHNSHLWSNSRSTRRSPILMICYTNHALDQFLELCVEECNLNSGVVRVGGRCKNKSLEGFFLRKIKENIRQERSIEKSIFYQMKEEQRRLSEIQTKLNKIISTTKLSEEGILKLSVLSKYASVEYMSQFSTDFELLQWLGFDEANFNSQVGQIDQVVNAVANMEIDDNEEDEDEENMDDLEMDDDENDERMLDDDFIVHSKSKTFKSIDVNQIEYIENKSELIFTENDICKQFTSEWSIAGSKKNSNPVKNHFKKIITWPEHNDIVTYNLWRLNQAQRISLYNYWVFCFKADKDSIINQLKQQYDACSNSLQELRLQEDRSIMQNAYIVAMTTTGSARYHTILRDIGPRIVIVEEAAEVFEAHIVASLSKHCEHLILIGDHVQLRPKPNVYDLEKNFNLGVSMFERLLLNKIPHVTLKCQRRMRPEISVLMKHFYKRKIHDHESVINRDNILGIKKNIFFVAHTNAEDNYEEGKSKINKFEAQYLVKLCKFLIKQGYLPSQITILTTYLGQMFHIKTVLNGEKVKEVRVYTVDNYQGEENDIILLSLVRSNDKEKIGFLSIENRICVAFSRARLGFYCIGNFNLLNKTSIQLKTKWAEIIQGLKERDSISTGLHLTCGIHPRNDLIACNPADFNKRPEGGCDVPCEYRLPCGHACSLFCHLYDSNHERIVCSKNCEKKKLCGHLCKMTCGHKIDCNERDCTENVIKRLACGHDRLAPCFKQPSQIICLSPCQRALSCGHKCNKKCSVQPCEPCDQTISALSICKHAKILNVPCASNTWNLQEECNSDCSTVLECGHLCKSNCFKCYGGRIHSLCNEKCNRSLICGHECKVFTLFFLYCKKCFFNDLKYLTDTMCNAMSTMRKTM